MIKLIFGIVALVLSIVLTVCSIIAFRNNNNTLGTILATILSLVGALASIFGLIMPGSVEIHNSKVDIKTQNVNIHDGNQVTINADKLNFESSSGVKFEMDVKARKDISSWYPNVFANIGEEVEFQIYFRNDGDKAENVVMSLSMPDNLEAIPGTVVLYNTTTTKDGKKGHVLKNEGPVSIGAYGKYGQAYVRFKARIKDENLSPGTNMLVMWAKISVGDEYDTDCATVVVTKQ